jgi:MFS family permease
MTQKNLTKLQRESVALILVGNFLEYFDLMLYVHMAIVLNDLFFPTSDPYTASLLAATTFSLTFLFRPIGALVFGYFGDTWGRKSVVIVSTAVMAFSSFVIASLPSYAQIGIIAPIALTLCRMLQGFSSVGEVTGAHIYVTEITSPPKSYFYVSLIDICSDFGSFFALLVGSVFLLIDPENGWRWAFFLGSGIAVIGSIARTRLRETPEFIQAIQKKKLKPEIIIKNDINIKKYRRNFLSYIGMECLFPLAFYICFIHMGNFLKTEYGYTTSQVIYNNLLVTTVGIILAFIQARLALRIYPLVIMKYRSIFLLVFLIFFPYLMNHATSPWYVFTAQCFLVVLGNDSIPAYAILVRGFPTLKRYTQAGLAFALSRAVMYPVTAYGCFFIGDWLGFEGIAAILAVFAVISLISIASFIPEEEDKKAA